jgi:predicted DNA-binding transcriptional regulator AlpA
MSEPLPPLAVDFEGLALLLSLSRRKCEQMNVSGALGPKPVRFGRAVRFNVQEISDWLDAGAPSREKWSAIREAQR